MKYLQTSTSGWRSVTSCAIECSEADTGGVLLKKVFLEILQNSQEKTIKVKELVLFVEQKYKLQ